MTQVRDVDICFTMSVVDEFELVDACRRHLRRAYPSAPLVLLADPKDPALLERWLGYAESDRHTRVLATQRGLYAITNGGLVVRTHLAAFLERSGDWWFKIDPDTFIRRPIAQLPSDTCFFGTIQTGDPRPSLQGGCIGGTRSAVESLYHSGILDSPALLRYEDTWAGANPNLLARAQAKKLVSFDFTHAWACERLRIPLVDHPEIKSHWLGPPRQGRRYAVTHPHKDLADVDPNGPDEVSPLAERLRAVLRGAVPDHAVVAVVSKGDDALLELDSREAWHFPRHARGCYVGHHPADADEAVRHLEEVRRNGAQFLVIPEPSLWWLEHYGGFRQRLEQCYRRVTLPSEDQCVIFDLAPSVKRMARRRHIGAEEDR